MDLRQISFLLICFVLYVGIGAIVFMVLESTETTAKDRERGTLHDIREKVDLLNLTDEINKKISEDIKRIIRKRQQEMPQEYEKKWGFFNSIFFSITVVTTIGYGHLSPTTAAGRIFCIMYAIFGIPMTGILLGAIGDRFSQCFLEKFKRLRKRTTPQLSDKLSMVRHVLLFFVPWFIVFLILPSIMFKIIEEWSFLESFYYCFVTLSTIGFGDLVIGQFDKDWVWMYKIAAVLWIIFGLAYLSMILNFITQVIRSRPISNVVHSIRRISAPPRAKSNRVGNGSTPSTPSPRPPVFDAPDFTEPQEKQKTNQSESVAFFKKFKLKKLRNLQESRV